MESRDTLTRSISLPSSGSSPEGARIRVAWIGSKPDWLELDEALAELDGAVELEALPDFAAARALPQPPDLVHVPASAQEDLAAVRKTFHDSALVLDLSNGGRRNGRTAERRAAPADLVLLGSLSQLREFRRRNPRLAPRTALLPQPIDVTAHAPRATLNETRNRDLRRFQRFHRLAGPVVLFAGPYTQAGGLDLALEAVYALRERNSELRFAAIRHGELDRRYLDRCERRALGLGHHGILEWSSDPGEIPLWYALASVVCLPCREGVDPQPARLAAAAGRPFVGSEVEPLLEHVLDGQTGFLVPPRDLDTLTAALEALLGDEEEADRLGETARRRSEEELSPLSAARRLRQLWTETARERHRRA